MNNSSNSEQTQHQPSTPQYQPQHMLPQQPQQVTPQQQPVQPSPQPQSPLQPQQVATTQPTWQPQQAAPAQPTWQPQQTVPASYVQATPPPANNTTATYSTAVYPQSTAPYSIPVSGAQAGVLSTEKTREQRQPLAANPKTVLAFFGSGLLGSVLGGLLVFALIMNMTGGVTQSTSIAQTPTYQVVQGDTITITPLSDDPTLAEVVAAKVLPSVVNIDVYVSYPVNRGGSSNWGSDSVNDRELIEYSLGSGIVLTEDGYILTNYHVVEDGDEFMVRFDRDTQLRAELVGSDPSSDLAVLKVDASGLIPIDIGDSDSVHVGEWVMALGSPFGLEKTVSVGIVSALLRSTTMESVNELTIYANMIQTDAAINPGNSGRALVNSRGELIGINTLIMSSTDSSAGVGFAIPINYAHYIAMQIVSGDPLEHAFLGVSMTTVDPSNAAALGTNVSYGAYVDSVVTGSPADDAGIQRGDVIVRIGDMPIATSSEVLVEIRGYKVGDQVKVVVIRNGTSTTFDVRLGSDLQR